MYLSTKYEFDLWIKVNKFKDVDRIWNGPNFYDVYNDERWTSQFIIKTRYPIVGGRLRSYSVSLA